MLRVALAQINPTVGDIAGNVKLIASYRKNEERARANICLFPELAMAWRGLLEAAEHLTGASSPTDVFVTGAEEQIRRVVLMARADGLDASGRAGAADDMAVRVVRLGAETSAEGADG